MNRRSFLAAAMAAHVAAQTARRPNILFVLADDLGWGDLACYGNRFIPTPSLDKLAAQGSLFTQFYVANPVCSPSRTAFLSGHFPARHRIHGHFAAAELNANRGMPNWLDTSTPMLPRMLQQAGYRTAHYGKWHLGSGPGAPVPSAYGFDEFRSINGNGPTWEQDEYFRARSTGVFVDEALRFIAKDKSKPFYAQIWSLLPHAPLNPTDDDMMPFQKFNPVEAKRHTSARTIFYASVAALDRDLGKLFDGLERLGVADNTIVLFSSDNGPEEIFVNNAGHSGVGSPGPFRGRKRSLYEGGVRLPFIVRWPGKVPAGRVDASVIGSVDMLPTILKLTGVPVPANAKSDGEDRSAVLLGASLPRTKPLFWEWRFNIAGHVNNVSPMLSMRDGDWKLMMNPDKSRVELYSIVKDPMEVRNVAPENPQVVEKMMPRLEAWSKELPPGPRDPAAGKNDYPWPRPTKGKL
ncbi:MAG: sulfatase-like hydrolase/transferase [Candidatus Solibacter usitatus]|nr:sulfatase-like hydrolase/transferase [Candidatus Solibacter usitatus]